MFKHYKYGEKMGSPNTQITKTPKQRINPIKKQNANQKQKPKPQAIPRPMRYRNPPKRKIKKITYQEALEILINAIYFALPKSQRNEESKRIIHDSLIDNNLTGKSSIAEKLRDVINGYGGHLSINNVNYGIRLSKRNMQMYLAKKLGKFLTKDQRKKGFGIHVKITGNSKKGYSISIEKITPKEIDIEMKKPI